MSEIKTYGIHEMFNFNLNGDEKTFENDISKTESSTVISNNGITLSIDIPDSAVNKISDDKDLISKSVISKVDYLLLTHLDSDHVSGLDKLLWWKKFGEKQKLNIIAHPENFEGIWDRLKYGFSQNRTKSKKEVKSILDYINYIPLDFGEEVKIPNFGSVRSFERSTNHSPCMPVTAFKVFDEKKENIANFSADTKFDSELIEFLSSGGNAPIIHEIGAYGEGTSSHTHIKELIEKVEAKHHSRIFTNHISVMMEDSIKTIIEETGTDIRFADIFYSENKKKEVELSEIKKYFDGLSLDEIKNKVPEILNPKTVIFSGSFDPWTYGHEAVISDYLKMNPNSKVKVVIAVNPNKKTTFTPEERKILIEKTLTKEIKNKVEVDIYSGVIADYVYENGYSHVVKGIRNETDFIYEQEIATLSKKFAGDIMTSFIPQMDVNMTGVSSSSLKALSKFGGEIYADANPVIREALRMKQTGQLIIGLTGGIGSGKSTLGKGLEKESKLLKVGIYYLNMDEITNDIHTKKDTPLYQITRNKIAVKFGKEILKIDGTTNKKKLGEIVFNNSMKMEELMDIMLEPLMYFLRKRILEIKEKGIILVEGAVIFDRKLTYVFDENIIHIGISPEKQRERIEKRDGFTNEQIEIRLNNQVSREDRVDGIKTIQNKYSDRLFIDIDGSDYNLLEIYEKLIKEYDNRLKTFKNDKTNGN